ncbi:MAG: 30S ribosomal protein S14 [Hyphomicrobiales bacterium]|jgi:small subunit ribosomal protein S14
MAKKSSIENNNRRMRLVERYKAKRKALKALAADMERSDEERFEARVKLAELPRNGSATRVRLRCLISGRPRGVYRKLKMSRIALRDLGSKGMVPGLVKSSW